MKYKLERILIVDENDNVIGSKIRNEITNKDIYRGTSLWIEDGKGNVLLTKRALGKRNDPGKWMPAACAGTVAEGETYEENLIKEAKEELGLDLTNIEIVIVDDPACEAYGPIWVRGGVEIESEDGFVYEKRNRVTLCNCGKSTNKPFCDGRHLDVS